VGIADTYLAHLSAIGKLHAHVGGFPLVAWPQTCQHTEVIHSAPARLLPGWHAVGLTGRYSPANSFLMNALTG
jgi:hypothetical protein